uniref:Uncharacterized protein n=1 Tax=Chromera velia CCMP2878 TaxID=1169474 RepID=A0A0G4G2R4_9ALVE|eukprot:Cvel_19894.t1-p1 / transcript=Cvel_19894.t1 / gene=Cvel_19894 / organism=Chromera_velia_CCMP2878 / gene_product=hypothetical protein / transcript_product=hypothetical protein / location=Cvel_scaffold1746:22062-26304(+) / protein_length=647 / sequence_SO=supercontig / SO=protein_coding / is_pseudo=false
MAFGFRGVSSNAAVRGLSSLSDPTSVSSSSYLSSVRSALNGEVNVRKIELAMMVKVPDMWVMAVATALDQSFEGQIYDFNDLPSRVVAHRKQIIATDAIPFSDFSQIGAPEWDDKLSLLGYTGLSDTDAEFSVSKLAAADRCSAEDAPIVGRFTATPVYASSDTSKTGPVKAVLVSADMLNGKTAVNEWSMTSFQSGYVAVYTLTGEEGSPNRQPILLGSLLSEPREFSGAEALMTGVRQLVEPQKELLRQDEAYKTSELRVDVDLADGQEDQLSTLLERAAGGARETVTMILRNRNYFVSAVQAPPDLINFVPTSDRYDDVFLVRGVWEGADDPTRFILKYERLLFDMEAMERKRLLKLFRNYYPQLLHRRVVRPWCCLCSSCGGIEVIENSRDRKDSRMFDPKLRESSKKRMSLISSDSRDEEKSDRDDESPDVSPAFRRRPLLNTSTGDVAVQLGLALHNSDLHEASASPAEVSAHEGSHTHERRNPSLRRTNTHNESPTTEKRESRRSGRFASLPSANATVTFKGALTPHGVRGSSQAAHRNSPVTSRHAAYRHSPTSSRPVSATRSPKSGGGGGGEAGLGGGMGGLRKSQSEEREESKTVNLGGSARRQVGSAGGREGVTEDDPEWDTDVLQEDLGVNLPRR